MPTYLHCSHCYATATANSRDFGIKDREQNLPKFVVLDSNYCTAERQLALQKKPVRTYYDKHGCTKFLGMLLPSGYLHLCKKLV
jgi:hypothetical protein